MESKLDAMFNQWLKVRVSFKTEAEALKAVEDDGDALQYVKDQTEAICLKAVESDGYALRYVKDQTEAICLKAVESDGDACTMCGKEGGYEVHHLTYVQNGVSIRGKELDHLECLTLLCSSCHRKVHNK